MLVRDSIYDRLVELVKSEDSAGLKFFLRWERDRRSYLQHRNKDGLTLLHHACLLGKLNVVHSLVDCGCDIEGRSSVGWTALHAGALSGNYKIVSYLVNTCASNVLAMDDMGCRPIDLTLDPQITTILKTKTDNLLARTSEEDRNLAELSAKQSLKIFDEKIRSHSTPEMIPKRRDQLLTQVRGENIIFKYMRLRESEPDRLSLPGDTVSKNQENRSHMVKVIKKRKGLSERDSGIYEDLPDVGNLAIKPVNSKKERLGIFLPFRGKSSKV